MAGQVEAINAVLIAVACIRSAMHSCSWIDPAMPLQLHADLSPTELYGVLD